MAFFLALLSSAPGEIFEAGNLEILVSDLFIHLTE
jgi:hypothetical protein